MGIEDEVQELLEENPILFEDDFRERYPGIVDVVAFLNKAAEGSITITGSYKLFDRLGVKNISDYLSLIQKGDKEAIRIYEVVRDTLGFI